MIFVTRCPRDNASALTLCGHRVRGPTHPSASWPPLSSVWGAKAYVYPSWAGRSENPNRVANPELTFSAAAEGLRLGRIASEVRWTLSGTARLRLLRSPGGPFPYANGARASRSVWGGKMRRSVRGSFTVSLVMLVVLAGSAGREAKSDAVLGMEGTATGVWTRTFGWSVSKSVSPTEVEIVAGGGGEATWAVSVIKDGGSDQSNVSGEACLTNSGLSPTEGLTVASTVEYREEGRGKWLELAFGPVDVAANPVLDPGESHCYPYSLAFAPVPNASYQALLVASATIPPGNKPKTTETATPFSLPESPSLINDSVTVNDTNGQSWTFAGSGSESYSETFTSVGTYTNTATIVETSQTAAASVVVSYTCATTWDAVAYWCFDDQLNPTADGANGHDATLVGAGFSNVTPPGVESVASLQLDGIDDYGRVLDPNGSANLDGFSAITIAAWINPDVVSGGPYEIVTKYASGGPFAPDGSGSGVAWGLDIQGGVLRFVYNWEEFEPSTTTIQTGTWTHVAGTWNGSDVRLYINGTLAAFGDDIFTSIPDTSTPVNIGAAEANVSGSRFAFFDGHIDEAYVFDRALTDSEIASLAGVAVP